MGFIEDANVLPPPRSSQIAIAGVNQCLTDLRTGVRRNHIDIRDYGAVDGADSTTAMDNAVAAAATYGVKHVYVPVGTWLRSSLWTIPAGVVVVGEDETTSIVKFISTPTNGVRAIKLDAVGAGLERLGIWVAGGKYYSAVQFRASRTFVRGCKIEYTTPDVTAADFAGISGSFILYATDSDSVGSAAMKDVRIEDCDISATASSGAGLKIGDVISVVNVPGIYIGNNRIHDVVSVGSTYQNWGIYVSKKTIKPTVENNILENLTGGLSGIHFNDDPNQSGNGTMYPICRGNYLKTIDAIGISVDFCVGAVVEGNTVINTATGIQVVGEGTVDAGHSNKILNNHLETLHTTTDPGLGSERTFINVDEASTSNTIVKGNTLGDKGGAGTKSIYVKSPRTQILGNRFASTSPRAAIELLNTADNCLIANNYIPSLDGATGGQILVGSDGNLITGNLSAAGGTGAAGSVGVRIAGDYNKVIGNKFTLGGGSNNNAIFVASGDRNVIHDNDIVSASTGGINDSGTNTIRHSNNWGTSDAALAPGRARGRSTQSGDGATTAFTISHGLYTTPASVSVTAGHAAARGDFHVTVSSTQITVTFGTAPVAGASNVVLNWQAEV